jgi:serine/threonine protein kinase
MSEMIHVEDKYKLINKIGSGSFGEVYIAMDKNTNKSYAAKIEEKKSNSRLKEEYDIYKKLKKRGIKTGIPKVITYIETNKQHILIMQLLGKSLDNVLEEKGGTFDLGTVLKLGLNITELLEKIHDAGFIHRDIKPNNFLLGLTDIDPNVYIMDFGLSKQYISVDKKHIDMKVERTLVGTARYASINVHMGIEPARRDDLESVGYMLIYFLKGRLPWQGLKKKKGTDQIKLIGDTKMCVSLSKLCNELPICFFEYIKYCKKLNFEENPDYEYLKDLFIKTAEEKKIELKYCWI